MKDFVVYHNPDSMGQKAGKAKQLCVLTNRRVAADVVGDRVWLLTGEGSPRNYYLVFWFFIDEVVSGRAEGFETMIRGNVGEAFDPMIPIDKNAEWFQEFKRDQGNFAWGFSPITRIETVERLEMLIKRAP